MLNSVEGEGGGGGGVVFLRHSRAKQKMVDGRLETKEQTDSKE